MNTAQPPEIAYHDVLNIIVKNPVMTPREIIFVVGATTQNSKLKKYIMR
jgi:hypothetical protein